MDLKKCDKCERVWDPVDALYKSGSLAGDTYRIEMPRVQRLVSLPEHVSSWCKKDLCWSCVIELLAGNVIQNLKKDMELEEADA